MKKLLFSLFLIGSVVGLHAVNGSDQARLFWLVAQTDDVEALKDLKIIIFNNFARTPKPVQPVNLNERNSLGMTPLMIAARSGNLPAVRLLLAVRNEDGRPVVNVRMPSRGRKTALKFAQIELEKLNKRMAELQEEARIAPGDRQLRAEIARKYDLQGKYREIIQLLKNAMA